MITKVEVQILPDGRLDAKNAAKYLGLSVKTLAMFRSSGKGPEYLKRGKVFYFQTALDDWLKEGQSVITSHVSERSV